MGRMLSYHAMQYFYIVCASNVIFYFRKKEQYSSQNEDVEE